VNGKALALAAACLLSAAPPERVCRHPARGACRPVSLERASRARAELADSIRSSWHAQARLATPSSWDSGLPGCPARAVRRVRAELPAALAGRTIGFGPAGAEPAADLKAATRLRGGDWTRVEALADRALARVISEAELELVENP
jgi:hypothetical protein